MPLRLVAFLFAFALLAPGSARASVTSLASISLIDRGQVTTSYANDRDVRLADTRLDAGGGDGAVPNNVLAAIVSFFLPGVGQIIWQNQLVKGIVLFAVALALHGALWGFLGRAGLLTFAYHLLVAYDAYVGGSFIPNFGGGGGGGDLAPEEREALLVATRVLEARPVEAHGR